MKKPVRNGTRIKDRKEYESKPAPLALTADTLVIDAVREMNKRNYGSVIVVDDDHRVEGLVTERDILRKLVGPSRDPNTTALSQIMTSSPRVAREDDDIIEWLRIMSNERFRRLPIVDDEGKLTAVFTQGDFVSYTWPDLLHQAREIAKATVSRNFNMAMIGGGILLYSAAMIGIVTAI